MQDGNFEKAWDYQTRVIRLVPSILLYAMFNYKINEFEVNMEQINEIAEMGYQVSIENTSSGQVFKVKLEKD